MAASKVAVVTGAAGGIGVPMCRVLLGKGYHVVIADTNTEAGVETQKTLGDRTLFIQCDLTDWEAHTAMFKKAFEWHGRIDACVANAGIAEKEKFYAIPDIELEPTKPNLLVVDLDLNAVIYGLKLFRHYWKKSGNSGLGRMIITSSMAGIYAFPAAPLYSAAKHGVVGLVRAASYGLHKNENITVNTICPGPVDTGISEEMKKVVPEHRWTPMRVVLGSFEKILDEDITGQCVEASNKQFYLRDAVEYSDENSEFLIEDMKKHV